MARTVFLILLFAAAGLLPAQGLIDELFADRIADDWHHEMRQWVETECEQRRFPETWFLNEEGAPVQHRILGVKDGKLSAAPLRPTGRADDNGNPITEQGEVTFFDWEDWKPRYMISTYLVADREDRSLVGLAVWMYGADQPLLANRALTVIYERNKELREKIEDFVRTREAIPDREKLIVAEAWDDEFRRPRRVLMSESTARERDKAREQTAATELERLTREYEKPEVRTLTLDRLGYELSQWGKQFAGTKAARNRAKAAKALGEAIERDKEAVRGHLEVAGNQADPKKRAEGCDKALELDPCSIHVLARAAKAWMDYAEPEVKGKQFICTQEHGARRAGELYQRWLEIEPGNTKAMLNRAVCHHVIGNRTEAQALYQKIIELGGDDDAVADARRYKDLN